MDPLGSNSRQSISQFDDIDRLLEELGGHSLTSLIRVIESGGKPRVYTGDVEMYSDDYATLKSNWQAFIDSNPHPYRQDETSPPVHPRDVSAFATKAGITD